LIEDTMAIQRILIVDDSPTERFFLADLLGKNGYEINMAENGTEALEKAKLLKPDLILMDVVMPGMNGFQATRAISRDDEVKHIPVILCTTKNQETDKIWGMRQGAIEYMTKPIDGAALLQKIRSL
jgi:twitching motility two-component system response regulator PilH